MATLRSLAELIDKALGGGNDVDDYNVFMLTHEDYSQDLDYEEWYVAFEQDQLFDLARKPLSGRVADRFGTSPRMALWTKFC